MSFGSGEVNGKETQNAMTAAKVGACRKMAFACAKGKLMKAFLLPKGRVLYSKGDIENSYRWTWRPSPFF